MTMMLLMMAMTIDETTMAAAMARAREKTRAGIPCQATPSDEEIVVCGRRQADRFRLPLETERADGDPKAVDAFGERARLLRVPELPCGVGAFLQRCGMVGATVSTRTGARGGGQRPLAD